MRREYIVKQTANGTRVRRAPKPLSAAQCDVLVKLADGWELNMIANASAWLSFEKRRHHVSLSTTRVLFSRCCLTKLFDGTVRVYTISEIGHAALAEAPQQ